MVCIDSLLQDVDADVQRELSRRSSPLSAAVAVSEPTVGGDVEPVPEDVPEPAIEGESAVAEGAHIDAAAEVQEEEGVDGSAGSPAAAAAAAASGGATKKKTKKRK